MVEKSKIAFSVGGLGGSNAHSAGFLAAARELKVEPDLIACTSGPLLWVYDYIRGIDLKEVFEKLPRYSHPIYKFFDPRLRRQVREFMYFAVAEYWARWFWPFPFRHSSDDIVKNATDWWLDRLLPAHVLNESHGDEWFDDIAFTFNSAKTPSGKPLGIVFNVFKPETGTEYLYANDAAVHDGLVSRSKTEGDESRVHKTQIMSPINGEAVRDALRFWLYGFERPIVPWSYGFGVRSFERIDGGYHRQIILRELHGYDRIYTVRPQAQGWIGDLPRNTLELMDLIVELWFNSSYAGDVAGLELINDLLERGKLPPTDYKHVEIIPVEVQKNYGFTDYFGESPELFEAAYMQSSVKFAKDIGSHLVEAAEAVSTPLVTTLPHAA